MIDLDYESTIKGDSPSTIQCLCCESIIEVSSKCRIYFDNKYKIIGVSCLHHPLIKIKDKPLINYGNSINSVISNLAGKECSKYIIGGCITSSNDPANFCAVCLCKLLLATHNGPPAPLAPIVSNPPS